MEKINGVISEYMVEVNKRLQKKENKKTRELLALAMGQYQAMQHIKKEIEKEVKKVNGYNKTN
jgi:hypothetical protein